MAVESTDQQDGVAAVDPSSSNKDTQEEEEEDYIKTTTHNFISRKAVIKGARNVELKGRSIVEKDVTFRGDLAVIRIGRYCLIQQETILQPSILVCSSSSTSSSSSSSSPSSSATGTGTTSSATATPSKGSNDPTSTTSSGGSTSTASNNKNHHKYITMTIGNHTHIGSNCTIEAAAIGSMVYIGNHVQIGKRCIIKDCCVIDSNVILGDDTVVPPFTRISSSSCWNNNTNNTNTHTNTNNTILYNAILCHPQSDLPPSISVELQEVTMQSYQDFVSRQQKEMLNINKK